MASECLVYAQGQTATVTAQFVTASGQPIDVPDAQIRIVGPGGVDILALSDMIHVFTGFYYYDYPVPNSLPVNTYTIVISGTVLGTTSSMSISLKIVLAGVKTPASFSQHSIELVAALERYIGCAQHIPIYQELAARNGAGDQYSLNWPRWNLSNYKIRLNNEIVSSGYTVDLDTGVITFAAPLHPTDRVMASYNFRFFTQLDMLGFLSDAIGQINIEPPQNVMFSLDNFPDQFVGVLLQGAAKNAIKQMLFCLAFQEPQTIFGGPERAKESIDTFKALKENYEKEFTADKKTLKTKMSYPKISAIVQPEHTLPGGRARWFRYMFSTNAG